MRCASSKPFGPRARAQENTVAHFLVLAVFLGLYILRKTAGAALFSSCRGVLRCCCGCALSGTERLQARPPFCGMYAVVVPAGTKVHITKYDKAQGWTVVRDSRGRVLKIRMKPEAASATNVARGGAAAAASNAIASRRMRTWEVLQGQGLASYDPVANAVYAPAMRALEAARLRYEADLAARRGVVSSSGRGTAAASAPARHVVGAAARQPQWTYAPPPDPTSCSPAHAGGAASGPVGSPPLPQNAEWYGGVMSGGALAPLPLAALALPGMEFAAAGAGSPSPRPDVGLGSTYGAAGGSFAVATPGGVGFGSGGAAVHTSDAPPASPGGGLLAIGEPRSVATLRTC